MKCQEQKEWLKERHPDFFVSVDAQTLPSVLFRKYLYI